MGCVLRKTTHKNAVDTAPIKFQHHVSFRDQVRGHIVGKLTFLKFRVTFDGSETMRKAEKYRLHNPSVVWRERDNGYIK